MDTDVQKDIDKSSLIASTNKVDSPKIDRDELQAQVATKVDTRNSVDHTFKTTAEEAFFNTLGRVPTVAHIGGQSKAGNVFVNISKCTKTTLYATSSVTGLTARLVLA